MASVINTNMASLYAQKNLSGAQNALSTSVERLSSGLRINRAKDDAAGLGISEKIKSQVTSLNQGLRNANDAISMVQTAEGSLSEVSSILQRMKELSVQARNDSLSTTQRSFISDELVALKNEINSIAERTTFNDLSLLKNALRTQVAVPTAGDVSALANGAQLLEGLTVKDLAITNTNAGTYTFSAAKDTQLANQKSHAVGATVGTIGTDTTQSAIFATGDKSITLSGVFEVGDTIEIGTSAGADKLQTLAATNKDITSAVTSGDVSAELANFKFVNISLGGVSKQIDLTAVSGSNLTSIQNLATTITTGLRAVFDDGLSATTNGTTITVTDAAGRTINALSYHTSANAPVTNSTATINNAAQQNNNVTNFALTDLEADKSISLVLRIGASDLTINTTAATNGATLASIISDAIQGSAVANKANVKVVYANGRIAINGLSQAGSVDLTTGAANATHKMSFSGGSTFVYRVTAENLTLNNDGRSAAVTGGSLEARTNIAASLAAKQNAQAAGLGTATASGAKVTFTANPASIANGAELAVNRTANSRKVTVSADDVAEGNKLTIKVGSKEYSVVAGTGDTTASVANGLQALLTKDYGGTVTVANTNEVTFSSAAGVDVADISVSLNRIKAGELVAKQASYTSAPDRVNQNTARNVVINSYDVVEGNQFTLKVGTPEFVAEFNVIADHNDTFSDIASKLQVLANARFGGNVVLNATADQSRSLTLNAALNLGTSVVDLTVRRTSVNENLAVKSVVSAKGRADTARTITINQSDLAVGNVFSLKVNGKEYAVKAEAGELSADIAYRLASLLQKDFPNTDAATATVEFPVGRRVDIGSDIDENGAISGTELNSTSVITLHSLARLGLADISLNVLKKANAGDFTLTADANTGIGGTSQTINVGQIAAGGSKTFDFDNLGVQFTVANSRATAVDSSSFAVSTSKVNKLTVDAMMNGEALFQVGAGTRDNVVLDGFKDIRITGQNKNTGSEKEVFDKINETLTTIAANTTESLSTANFATLENRIEDAITMVSDFRSYFGGQQNRIEFAISNIQAQSENLTAANSRIVDTDYAAETANLTKTQIMQQAATAMLAQANQMPNVILALLK